MQGLRRRTLWAVRPLRRDFNRQLAASRDIAVRVNVCYTLCREAFASVGKDDDADHASRTFHRRITAVSCWSAPLAGRAFSLLASVAHCHACANCIDGYGYLYGYPLHSFLNWRTML